MRAAVTQALEDLVAKTREILVCPDPHPDSWECYRESREAIFSLLRESGFPVEPEEEIAVRRLIEEISRQEACLRDKIQEKLGNLRSEMAGLKRSHQAVTGYASSQRVLLLERSV